MQLSQNHCTTHKLKLTLQHYTIESEKGDPMFSNRKHSQRQLFKAIFLLLLFVYSKIADLVGMPTPLVKGLTMQCHTLTHFSH